jgi:hypothetical protein
LGGEALGVGLGLCGLALGFGLLAVGGFCALAIEGRALEGRGGRACNRAGRRGSKSAGSKAIGWWPGWSQAAEL